MLDTFKPANENTDELSSREWNAVRELSRRYSTGTKNQNSGVPLNSTKIPSLIATVKNSSGAACSTGYILKVVGALAEFPNTLLACNDAPYLDGDEPDATTNVVVITDEPIANGEYGRAVITGIVTCKVNITDAGHDYATPTSGDTTKLTSAASGPIKILAKASAGTGDKDCMVLLQDIRSSGASGGGSELLIATGSWGTIGTIDGHAFAINGQAGKVVKLTATGTGTTTEFSESEDIYITYSLQSAYAGSVPPFSITSSAGSVDERTYYTGVDTGKTAGGKRIFLAQPDATYKTAAETGGDELAIGGALGSGAQRIHGPKTVYISSADTFSGTATLIYIGGGVGDGIVVRDGGLTISRSVPGTYATIDYAAQATLAGAYILQTTSWFSSSNYSFTYYGYDGATWAAGSTDDVVVGDGAGGTKTLHFSGGIFTGVT